jgi:biopolymer transport protein ExbD
MHSGLELSLPAARTSDTQETEETVVHITKDGKLYLNTEPVSWDGLKTSLQNGLAAENEKSVVVKADKDVPFGIFVRVMDIFREVGLSNLVVSTTVPEDPVNSPTGKGSTP